MNGKCQGIESHLSEILGKSIQFIEMSSISGGCINNAWKVTDNQRNHWFIKTNLPQFREMFQVEAAGLDEIVKNQCIRAPKVITTASLPELSFIILEYIPLQAHINQALTGNQLAKMHQASTTSINAINKFGWMRNNTIGSTTQSNQYSDNWASFWKKERLLYQLDLAKKNGYPYKAYDKGLKLAECLPLFFSDYQPKPSLLHGDLWSGNCASDLEGKPVIFDPAVYYGDREADIAMTELFGGFNKDFYDAYNANYALDSGYKTRKTLYNLYHILNHYNLFRGSYASQAENMTLSLLSEVRR